MSILASSSELYEVDIGVNWLSIGESVRGRRFQRFLAYLTSVEMKAQQVRARSETLIVHQESEIILEAISRFAIV